MIRAKSAARSLLLRPARGSGVGWNRYCPSPTRAGRIWAPRGARPPGCALGAGRRVCRFKSSPRRAGPAPPPPAPSRAAPSARAALERASARLGGQSGAGRRAGPGRGGRGEGRRGARGAGRAGSGDEPGPAPTRSLPAGPTGGATPGAPGLARAAAAASPVRPGRPGQRAPAPPALRSPPARAPNPSPPPPPRRAADPRAPRPPDLPEGPPRARGTGPSRAAGAGELDAVACSWRASRAERGSVPRRPPGPGRAGPDRAEPRRCLLARRSRGWWTRGVLAPLPALRLGLTRWDRTGVAPGALNPHHLWPGSPEPSGPSLGPQPEEAWRGSMGLYSVPFWGAPRPRLLPSPRCPRWRL